MAKVAGKDFTLTVSGSTVAITDFSLDVTHNEIDVTDTATTGDATETIAGTVDRSWSADVWLKDTETDLTMGVEAPITASFNGKTYTGTGIILSKGISVNVSDAAKTSYSGKFNGTVTVTPLS